MTEPMKEEFWFDSCGAGRIFCCKWSPQGEPKAIVQIVHGIAEHIARYDTFANYLTEFGYLVVAEDHMGHGQSVNGEGIQGYVHGGWFSAVKDTYRLLRQTKAEYPDVPYILLGHSMGSFMARTILYLHPDSGIDAAIISGTCWQPAAAMPAVVKFMESACWMVGETNVSPGLQNLMFGTYNARVEHPRTNLDWICRDSKVVDAHPMMQGFAPSAGLLRDMMVGINAVERKENLTKMKKDLPVFFIAGGDDPVGGYGRGVHACANAFRTAGMTDVSVRIYPLCRHEILNEINKEEIFEDIIQWIEKKIK